MLCFFSLCFLRVRTHLEQTEKSSMRLQRIKKQSKRNSQISLHLQDWRALFFLLCFLIPITITISSYACSPTLLLRIALRGARPPVHGASVPGADELHLVLEVLA